MQLDVENRSAAPTSFLLLEDRQPPTLGRSARLVVSGIPPRGSQRVSYTVLPQTRGRYRLGPLSVDISDPFALTRQRIEFDERDELLVTPEIEDLLGGSDGAVGQSFGASRARQLFRTGEEYYTMRGYQEGDDLRRIHWAIGGTHRRAHDPPGRVLPARERTRLHRHPRAGARPIAQSGLRAGGLGGAPRSGS